MGSPSGIPFVGSKTVALTATPTLDTSAYATGDALHTADIEFTYALGSNGGTGTVTGLTVIDRDDQGTAGELWLFSATTAATTHTANGAWSLHDTDVANCVAVLSFGPYFDGANNQVSVRGSISQPVKAAAGSRSLFGVLVTRGAPTYTASGLTVTLYISQD